MKLTLNGTLQEVSEGMNLQAWLETLTWAPGTFAVAIDEAFVPRGQYANTMLHDGMQVEIVVPMQGG